MRIFFVFLVGGGLKKSFLWRFLSREKKYIQLVVNVEKATISNGQKGVLRLNSIKGNNVIRKFQPASNTLTHVEIWTEHGFFYNIYSVINLLILWMAYSQNETFENFIRMIDELHALWAFIDNILERLSYLILNTFI